MGQTSHVRTPDWLTLEKDERVMLRVQPSKNVLLLTFGIGTSLLLGVGVLALVADVAVSTARFLSTAVLVFIFVLTGVVFLLTRQREYVVSTVKAYEGVGFRSKEIDAVDLDRITDVDVAQSGWQRRLNVGDVRLTGERGELLRFRYVEHPAWICERVTDAINDGA